MVLFTHMSVRIGVANFSDTVKTLNVKVCMTGGLIELYSFIPLSVTLTVTQRHSRVKQL